MKLRKMLFGLMVLVCIVMLLLSSVGLDTDYGLFLIVGFVLLAGIVINRLARLCLPTGTKADRLMDYQSLFSIRMPGLHAR